MILSIHQPSYWPWLGLLDKIAKSEQFVLLENVDANKASYQTRNIFFYNGEAKFLSLPTNYKLGIKIHELKIKNNKWVNEHTNKLYNYYLRAPFYNEVFPIILDIYEKNKDEEDVIKILWNFMNFTFNLLNIKVSTCFASKLLPEGSRGDLVLDICKKTKTTTYLAGKGSYDYMQNVISKFEENKIKIEWHNFRHPIYKQFNYEFIAGLSVLDILFFTGIEKTREIFWNNVKETTNV